MRSLMICAAEMSLITRVLLANGHMRLRAWRDSRYTNANGHRLAGRWPCVEQPDRRLGRQPEP